MVVTETTRLAQPDLSGLHRKGLPTALGVSPLKALRMKQVLPQRMDVFLSNRKWEQSF